MKWARGFYATREGIDMLSVVRNSMPVAQPGDKPEFALGKVHGYMEALAVMASLAVYPAASPEQVPVTYENPADEQETQEAQ